MKGRAETNELNNLDVIYDFTETMKPQSLHNLEDVIYDFTEMNKRIEVAEYQSLIVPLLVFM